MRALSWAEVDAIVARFEALNPYDRAHVPGSILRIEDVNYCEKTGRQREVFAYAISAKRYALFTLGKDGRPIILPGGYSEHGLGQYLNPIDPECEDRDWIRQVWEGIVCEALGKPSRKRRGSPFPDPHGLSFSSRLTVRPGLPG